MSMMIMEIELADSGFLELEGKQARYWSTGEGFPETMPIDSLPEKVLNELIARGLIKRA